MTLTLSKTVNEDVQIEVPSFWKNIENGNHEYIAVIDNNTVCKVYYHEHLTMVMNGTPESMKASLNNLTVRNSINNYQPVTESEFLSIYSEAQEAASLTPRLVEKTFVDDLDSIGIERKEVVHGS